MENLIYDVGAHLGEDSQHYLAKGFKVVAVEANPDLASHLRNRFSTEMPMAGSSSWNASYRRNGIPDILCQRDNDGVGHRLSAMGDAENARLGSKSQRFDCTTRPFAEIMKEFGVPYYLKIDVEGRHAVR